MCRGLPGSAARSSETVRSPHQDDVKFAAVSSGEQLIERRTLCLCAAYFVDVFLDDFEAALLSQPAKIKQLRFGFLIECRNACVQNCSLHPDHLSVLSSTRSGVGYFSFLTSPGSRLPEPIRTPLLSYV